MEGSYISWVALIGASGTAIAFVTFWVNRGKAEAENMAEAKSAHAVAILAQGKADLAISLLSEAKLNWANELRTFAKEYATHKDVNGVEARVAAALESVKVELRGTNDRLDRMYEHMINHEPKK